MVIQNEVEGVNHLVVKLESLRLECTVLTGSMVSEVQLAVHHAPVEPDRVSRYDSPVLECYIFRVVKVLEQSVTRDTFLELEGCLEGIGALDGAFLVVTEPIENLALVLGPGILVKLIPAVSVGAVSRSEPRYELPGIVVDCYEIPAQATHVLRPSAVLIESKVN